MAKFHSPNAGSGAANNGGGGADSGKIRAAHLLVKHNQSRRPMSWKEVRGGNRDRVAKSWKRSQIGPHAHAGQVHVAVQCCRVDHRGLYPATGFS